MVGGRRPEAMLDVPGVCELSLTRAVVHYRGVHELDLVGGRIEDIGLAVVLEGRHPAEAEVVDLGSAALKTLDLSGELVVVDWLHDPALAHLAAQVRTAAGGQRGALERLCAETSIRVLDRAGFTPVTRPVLLRIGFRDICRDLDLHEGTSVRLRVGRGPYVRAHFDYDGNALVFAAASSAAWPEFEGELRQAFPDASLHRTRAERGLPGGWQVRFTLPHDVTETRHQVDAVRRGLFGLMRRHEPVRYREAARLIETFGARDTLARLLADRGGVVEKISGHVGTIH